MGYMKDIQHTREIYQRGQEDPEKLKDVYEVKYYNFNQALEPEIKNFLESEIREANLHYFRKIDQID